MAPTYSTEMNSRSTRTPFNIHQEDSFSSASGSEHSSKGVAMEENIPMTTSRFANQLPRAHGSGFKSSFDEVQDPAKAWLKKQDGSSGYDAGNAHRPLMRRQSHQQFFTERQPANVAQSGTSSRSRPSLVPSTVSTGSGKIAHRVDNGRFAEMPQGNDENVNVALLKKELEEAKSQIAGLSHQLNQQHISQQATQQALEQTLAPAGAEKVSPALSQDLFHKLQLMSNGHDASAHTPSFDSHFAQTPLEATSNPWESTQPAASTRSQSSIAGWNPEWHSTGQPNPLRASGAAFERASGNCFGPQSRSVSGASMPSYPPRGWPMPYAPGEVPSSGFTPPLTPFDHSQSSNRSSWYPRPTAAAFGSYPELTAPWNMTAAQIQEEAQRAQYMPTTEPINYRKLLDRNTSCNWKYIVDKIICNNDQQASIFLQQKLKNSPPDMKAELVEAITDQAYPLMVNRFGNFLIQRCLEHGTPEQVSTIANTIRGKTLELSMDAFGCHVVQKALDIVPESYKAAMVHELLRQIPQTVVHRYACHVWQKLFELRWKDSPPQIMRYVNDALRGMWHEVALGETGSLVVQNIFENCLDDDKRPCVTEVLHEIDLIAHGQFGNWCIQHICEHGNPADKRNAIEHVLLNAASYSTDQFASKVVEKCLKTGTSDFVDRYLERICEARPDRPRMPLIDIAGDQYGNYLIQFILINTDTQCREVVAQHIRKHMVSLRGSKFGSRVALLCTNPALSTRPGPPMPFNDRYFNASNGFGARGPFGGR